MPSLEDTDRDASEAALGTVGPLDTLHDELMALPARTLRVVNIDVSVAALIVTGAAPDIHKHRAELVAFFGEERIRPLDRLDLLARATLQAAARHRVVESGAGLPELVERVAACRELLRAEVRSLIARKLLPAGVVGELTRGQGYKNISFDVLQLVAALRDSWDELRTKTGLTRLDLDEAERGAHQLVTMVGTRKQRGRSASAELRLRAYTLMASTYDDARRAITFLRWKDGDADDIAPSLFRGRGHRPARRAAPPVELPEHPELPVPAAPVRAGMPGGSPFAPGDATNDSSER